METWQCFPASWRWKRLLAPWAVTTGHFIFKIQPSCPSGCHRWFVLRLAMNRQ